MMRTLIFKIGLLAVITCCISILLHVFLYPKLRITDYSWGSEVLDSKRKFLLQHKKEINVLFVGSSKWAKQINPSTWDSIVPGSKSFNMGDNWFGAPETDYILKNLILNDRMSPKVVIMELSRIKTIKYQNLNTNRTHYWCNWKDYWFSLHAILSSSFSILEKGNCLLTYSITYLDQLINLGYVSEGLRAKANLEKASFEDSFNGFTCHDLEKYDVDGKLASLDTAAIENLAQVSANEFTKYEKDPSLLEHYNKVFLHKIIETIRLYKEKGITLIYCLPPRLPANHYKELLPLLSKIPEQNKIELCDSRKYPDLYRVSLCYDESHLNCEGSSVFTSLLANKAKKLMATQ